MASRRTEKAARVIRESVCDTILNRLSDPRIQGLVTVTEVEVSPDMKNATVFLSVIGVEESQQRLTFEAIRHAAGVIQAALGRAMTSKYVPHLHFEVDQKMRKTLETLRLIEQASKEYSTPEEPMPEDNRTDEEQ